MSGICDKAALNIMPQAYHGENKSTKLELRKKCKSALNSKI